MIPLKVNWIFRVVIVIHQQHTIRSQRPIRPRPLRREEGEREDEQKERAPVQDVLHRVLEIVLDAEPAQDHVLLTVLLTVVPHAQVNASVRHRHQYTLTNCI